VVRAEFLTTIGIIFSFRWFGDQEKRTPSSTLRRCRAMVQGLASGRDGRIVRAWAALGHPGVLVMPIKQVLQDVITILHRAERRRVWIKTDGYVPACLNPGDMDFAERFPADWLANYIHQEAVLGLDGFCTPGRGGKECSVFFVFDEYTTIIHLKVSRGADRHIQYVRV